MVKTNLAWKEAGRQRPDWKALQQGWHLNNACAEKHRLAKGPGS